MKLSYSLKNPSIYVYCMILVSFTTDSQDDSVTIQESIVQEELQLSEQNKAVEGLEKYYDAISTIKNVFKEANTTTNQQYRPFLNVTHEIIIKQYLSDENEKQIRSVYIELCKCIDSIDEAMVSGIWVFKYPMKCEEMDIKKINIIEKEAKHMFSTLRKSIKRIKCVFVEIEYDIRAIGIMCKIPEGDSNIPIQNKLFLEDLFLKINELKNRSEKDEDIILKYQQEIKDRLNKQKLEMLSHMERTTLKTSGHPFEN